MGLLDYGVNKGRARQKQALLEEAQKAGSVRVNVLDFEDELSTAAGLGSIAKMMVGGRLKSDGLQVFHLNFSGSPHLYVQPYSGANPLPGEHHAVLHGTLPAPAVLRAAQSFGRPRWECPGEPQLAAALNQHPQLSSAVRALEWEWPLGMGKIELDWALQFHHVGDGGTHVVMRPGRYGGFTTCAVGFSVFLNLCRHLQGWLQASPQPPQAPLEELSFSDFLPLLYGQMLPHVDVQVDAAQHASVAAFVSEQPGRGLAPEQARQLQAELAQVLQGTNVDAKINAAAGLMTGGQYAECILAYEHIAQQHPEQTGLCHSQVGAAHYFLGQFERALSHYEWAKQHGANPQMMDDNIAEAREALQQRPAGG